MSTNQSGPADLLAIAPKRVVGGGHPVVSLKPRGHRSTLGRGMARICRRIWQQAFFFEGCGAQIVMQLHELGVLFVRHTTGVALSPSTVTADPR